MLPTTRRGQFGFPAQAGVDGEAVGDAPVVLHIEREVGGAGRDLVGDLHGGGVDFAQQEAGEGIAGAGDAGQVGDERADGEVAGGAAVADLVVGAGAEFDAEFPGVLAAIPGERIQNLAVQDGGLEAVDRGGVAEGGVAGNGEGGEGGIADAL